MTIVFISREIKDFRGMGNTWILRVKNGEKEFRVKRLSFFKYVKIQLFKMGSLKVKIVVNLPIFGPPPAPKLQ